MDDEDEMLGASQGFETAGYDMGAVPFAAMRPGAGLARPGQAARPPAARPQFNPAILRQMQQAPGAVTAQQARQIAREEIERVRAGAPLVPWQSLPTRPTPREEAMWPLGLGLLVFNDTTAPGTPLSLVVSPQRPFRGERLVLDVRRIGASAQGPAVVINDFRVGDVPQRLGGGFLPAEVFAPDAFGVRLSLDASVPGVLITIGFTFIGAAIAAGDQIVISGAIIGRATEAGDR